MAALVEINTDGLAKLAETISFALGGTARGERKMAEAKAYAAELEVKTNNKVALIKAQGEDALANYIEAKEFRKLRNTVAVIEKAQSHFTEGENVSNEPVNEGWKNRFFNIVEEISDEELREIWGRVLAGEIKKPKSYSLRTLEVLRNLAIEEAAIIVKIAPYAIREEYIYRDCPLTIEENYTLQDCGILLDDGHSIQIGVEVKPHTQHAITLDSENTLVVHNDSDQIINSNLNVYTLSVAGQEIIKLVSMDKEIRNQVINKLVQDLFSRGFSKIYKHRIIRIDDDFIEFEDNGEEYKKVETDTKGE